MPTDSRVLPRFDELPVLAELGLRHAWNVYGPDDVLGSINQVTPQRVARAAASVITGELISLDLPLNLPDPPLYGRRSYRRHVVALNRNEMDDHLDDFHPQASTQWDSLNHVRCREYGYWGGRREDPTGRPDGLGVHHWAEHGVAGRGLLVDIAGWHEANGRSLDPLDPQPITVADLQDALEFQGAGPEDGDILCLRTGWVAAYRALDAQQRADYAVAPTSVGLHAGEEMARFLWDSHPAALCCDNPAVEMAPGDPAVGSLHRRMLPLLGLAMGEMFDFDRLAERCQAERRWTFFFVAAPLKIPGGVGSPGNAVAIR